MKVAVSTVMKDEPVVFIERWAKSAMDADEMVLVDTGSGSMEPIECARDLGVTVHQISVQPWRFDAARNAALALIDRSMDLVVKLDVDEVLQSGWRDALELAPDADRYSYEYVWSWTDAGAPDVVFAADHTHTRYGWQWEHPVHESLRWVGEGKAPVTLRAGFTIGHYADPTKSRSQYLSLLEQATRERPDDDRMAHYYARELFFVGRWVEARAEFVRHLSLPSSTWADERAQSYRYLAKMDDFPERWLLKAVAEAPGRREPWVDLADLYADSGLRQAAAGAAERALLITNRVGDYMSESHAWDEEHLLRLKEG